MSQLDHYKPLVNNYLKALLALNAQMGKKLELSMDKDIQENWDGDREQFYDSGDDVAELCSRISEMEKLMKRQAQDLKRLMNG